MSRKLTRREIWAVFAAYTLAMVVFAVEFLVHGQAWQFAGFGASLFGACVCVHILVKRGKR